MTNQHEDDQVLAITEHELAALTTLTEGAAPETCARLLGLEELRSDPALVRAGLSTLLLRGFGQVDAGVFTADDKGEVLAAIMGSATDWVRVHLAADGAEGISAFIASELATLFVELQPTGIYAARPLPASFDLPELVAGFVGVGQGDPVVEPPFSARIVRLGPEGERTVDFGVPQRGQLELAGSVGPAAEGWPQLADRLGYPRA